MHEMNGVFVHKVANLVLFSFPPPLPSTIYLFYFFTSINAAYPWANKADEKSLLFFLKYSLNVCSNCIATYFPQQVEGRSFSSWKMPETDFTFSLSTLSVASAAAFQPCSFLTKNASRVPLYTSVCLYLSVWKWRALQTVFISIHFFLVIAVDLDKYCGFFFPSVLSWVCSLTFSLLCLNSS